MPFTLEIFINLNYQPEKKRSRRHLFIYAGIAIILTVVSGILLATGFESSGLLLWFYLVYFLLLSLSLLVQSQGKSPIDFLGKSYLKIDPQGIACKPQMFNKNIISVLWSEIEEVEIKLFEIKLKVRGKWSSIDLEKLSDNNLKLVKQTFQNFQAELIKREKELAL